MPGRWSTRIVVSIAAVAVAAAGVGFAVASVIEEAERSIVLTAQEASAAETGATILTPPPVTAGEQPTTPENDTYRLFVDDGIPTAEARMAAAAAEYEVGGQALTVDREDGNRFEVDVVLDDRSTAEVLLDERFRVLAVDTDGRYDD